MAHEKRHVVQAPRRTTRITKRRMVVDSSEDEALEMEDMDDTNASIADHPCDQPSQLDTPPESSPGATFHI